MTRRRPCPPAPGPLEEYAARFDDLFGVLRAAAPGSTIQLTVLRGTDERSVQVTLGQPDADA